MKIVIVIPTHNRKKLLLSLLKQLHFQKNLNRYNIFIIVVVDGSTDGTIEMIKMNFPDVYTIEGDGSWWYTKSMNEGFKYAKKLNPDYVLTLNDDIEISEDYLDTLISQKLKLERNSILGSISFTVEKPIRILTSGAKKFNPWLFKSYMYYKPFTVIDVKSLSGIYPSTSLPGRGMIIPYSILEELKYFDERFIQYNSDIDFCFRAKRKGVNIYISYDARIFCHVSKTGEGTSFIRSNFRKFINNIFFNKYSKIYLPNKIVFVNRHGNKLLLPLYFIIIIFGIVKAYYFNEKIT